MAHHLTFGADVVFFGVLIWMFAKGRKDDSTLGGWPFVLAVFSVALLMIDPVRHILLDHCCVPSDGLAMYVKVDDKLHLTSVGSFCQKITITGYILLTIAVSGFFGLVQKFVDWTFIALGWTAKNDGAEFQCPQNAA